MYLHLLIFSRHCLSFFFFFNDTATTEIYTLSLHDALPISQWVTRTIQWWRRTGARTGGGAAFAGGVGPSRSEEHTSELQSHSDLVCRLLLEKKKKMNKRNRLREEVRDEDQKMGAVSQRLAD